VLAEKRKPKSLFVDDLIHWVDPDELADNPDNWRKHPAHQRDAVEDSIDGAGLADVAIYNVRSRRLVDGHLRRDVLKEKGALVPCIFVDASLEEEATLLASLDGTAWLAVPDRKKLELIGQKMLDTPRLKEMMARLLKDTNGGIVRGVRDAEVKAPHEDLAAKWRTAEGQIWRVESKTVPGGFHRLAVGSCLDRGLLDRLCGGDQAAMVYTDPPYGVDYQSPGTNRERLSGDRDPQLYVKALPVAHARSRSDAALYLWYADRFTEEVYQALREAGYQVRAELIWAKNNAQMGSATKHYKTKHEPLLYCVRRDAVAAWHGPANEVTVWEQKRESKNAWHPTQKPPDLASRAAKNSTRPGEVVLDLFLGSGATIVGCEQVGRLCYGTELSAGYAAAQLERFSQMGLGCSQEASQ